MKWWIGYIGSSKSSSSERLIPILVFVLDDVKFENNEATGNVLMILKEFLYKWHKRVVWNGELAK